MDPHPCAGAGGSRPRFEVADIVRLCGAAWIAEQRLTPPQRRVLRAIASCRTPVLGGHLDECEACGLSRPSYNSCRNRHCPKCQALAQHRWLEARRQRLLPVHHFHVVFTLPEQLRALVLYNRRRLFDVLFRSAAATLLELGRDPRWLGAELGLTAVLHTWTRDLSFHPHLHCVVPGAGLDRDGRLVSTRPGFLFPVHVLGALFRGKLLAAIERLYQGGKLELVGPCKPLGERARWRRLVGSLYDKRWVVYCKPPFGSADAVLSYLGRYTHRIAISNARLLDVTADAVSFRTRYPKFTALPPGTFLKRFLLHVLPKGFVRIRHYGTLAPANVHTRLLATRRALGGDSPHPSPPAGDETDGDDDEPAFFRWLRLLTGIDLGRCPRCHRRAVVRRPLPTVDHPVARAPP